MNGSLSDFIFGKISFTAENGFCDEFLSECVKRKIVIFNLKRTGNAVSGYVNFSERYNIAEAAEKTGMNLTFSSRWGLPHIVLKYRKRYGIPAGLLVFTVITLFLHSVLWSIDVSGIEEIPQENIEKFLADEGIKTGIFTDAVNCKEIEYSLYSNFENISWVNVHIIGTRMFVDISEVKVKELSESSGYSNIVASKDGEIITAEIYTGEGRLYTGTAVVKGDLLVSGVINRRDGSVKFVDSEAEIYARTKNFISSIIPSVISVKKLSECKDIYLPCFFGISVPSGICVKEKYITENKYFLRNDDVIFPVGLIRKTSFELTETRLELNENQARLLCLRDFAMSALRLYNDAQILESSISFASSDITEMCGEFLCIEDIALKKTFTVEDVLHGNKQ